MSINVRLMKQVLSLNPELNCQPLSPRFLFPLCWDYSSWAIMPWLILMRVLGIQTQILTLAQQSLLPTEPFPRPATLGLAKVHTSRCVTSRNPMMVSTMGYSSYMGSSVAFWNELTPG